MPPALPIKKHKNPFTHRFNAKEHRESMVLAYRALELYQQSRDFKRVADEMGVEVRRARELVNKAVRVVHPMASKVAETREKNRERERLLEHKLLQRREAVASNVQQQSLSAIADLRREKKPDREALDKAYERLAKADQMLARIQERRAKLEGLDAPSRTEVTGRDGEKLFRDTVHEMLATLKAGLPEEWYDAVVRVLAVAEVGGGGAPPATEPEDLPGAEGEGAG